MGVKGPEIFLAADPAMSLFPAPADRVDEAMAAEGLAAGESYLCFCLRDWKGGDRAPLFAQVARDAYRRHGLIPVFLAAEWPRDRAISHHTAGLLQVEGVPCRVVDHPYPVEVVIGLLGRMRTVVAMRLHALIFAASQGVPIVGVSYDVKVEGFMRSVESDSWLLLEELDVSRLSALIDGALEGQGVSRELKELLARRETKNRAAAARLLGLPFDETPQKEGM